MNDIPIDYADIEKDLGIHINSKLDWSDHCNAIYSKANQRFGLLKRTCHFVRNPNKRRAFYLSQVRSQFEHCTVVWRPSTQTTIDRLESLQKRALKWILDIQNRSLGDSRVYYAICKRLKILPLTFRFDYKDLLFFHSIFYEYSVVYFPSYIKCFSGSRLRRSHLDCLSVVAEISPNIPQNLTSSNIRCTGIAKSYFYRSHILWNRLPFDLREIESPGSFKANLLSYLWDRISDAISSSDDAEFTNENN